MGNFIQNNLLKNEKVVYTAHHHWTNYFTLKSLFSIGIIPLAEHYNEEFAITNQRVIIKKGILLIDTFEINFSRIESVLLYQTIAGRILNYGDVLIIGTGGTKYEVHGISNPKQFKKTLQETKY